MKQVKYTVTPLSGKLIRLEDISNQSVTAQPRPQNLGRMVSSNPRALNMD
jgi:hypothetical protein